jgi:predicted adenine nucleotide alpha hydrolase (AANH) superfamily ATPase
MGRGTGLNLHPLAESGFESYHTVMDERRATLLLHCCCGPCSTASIERLRELGYEPVLFYGNSNIHPQQEAERRYEALRKVAGHFNLSIVRHHWDHAAWLEAVAGHELDKERGARCALCFQWNLQEAAEQALRLGIDSFTTTLTVSPHKDSPLIFSIGKHHPGFVAVDFKKRGGYQRSLLLSKELELYRQDYCGCEFSQRGSAKQQQADGHDPHAT